MEAVRTSETSVDNHFTQRYIPEDNSEQNASLMFVEGSACDPRGLKLYSHDARWQKCSVNNS
jgi:hypothetical protein